MEPIFKSNAIVEVAVPNTATIQAPESVSLTLGAGKLTGLQVGSMSSNVTGNVYFKIFGRNGELLYPVRTSQPINASVPGGWAPVPQGGYISLPLNITVPGPNWDITIELVNYSAGSVNVLMFLEVGGETGESLLNKILQELNLLELMIREG